MVESLHIDHTILCNPYRFASAEKVAGDRVIVRWQRLFFNCLLLVLTGSLGSCNSPMEKGTHWYRESVEPQLALPVVEQVNVSQPTRGTLRWQIRFSQPMSASTATAITIRQVVAPERGGNNQGKVVEQTVVTGSGRLWIATAEGLDLREYGYFLYVARQAVNLSDLPMDGAAGEVSGNAGRSDEDYYVGGEPFVSLSTPPGDLQRAMSTRVSWDRPWINGLKLYYQRSRGEAYTNRSFTPFRTPFDGGRIVPAQISKEFAFRLSFTGPTRFSAMLDPASLIGETRIVFDSGGAATPRLAYNPNPNMLMEAGVPYAVTGYTTAGTTVIFWFKNPLSKILVGQGIEFNPRDRPWIFVGEEAIGTAPILPVYQWDNNNRMLIAGRSLGKVVWQRTANNLLQLAYPVLPAGWFHNRVELVFAGGATALVTGVDRTHLLLDRSLPVTATSGVAELRFIPLENILTTLKKVHFLADYLYVLPANVLQEGQHYRLTFGIQMPPVNLLGMPLSDHNRDGNERRDSSRNDRMSFSFSVQDLAPFPIPRTMLLNNGALYPMLFADPSWGCLSSNPLCVRKRVIGNCTVDEILLSFYTPDGSEDAPYGTQDLIRSGNINTEPVYMMRDSEGATQTTIPSDPVPLAWQVDTVFAAAPGGPTSLLRIRPENCEPLQYGDLLVVRHTLQAKVPGKKYTFDGNGDSVEQDSSEDDLLRYYAGSPTGFVTLEEFR